MRIIEQLFHLSENGTTPRTEVIAGLTTFVTMAYIIVVNPLILAGPDAGTGMDFGATMMATCLAAAAATLFMGLFANCPIALAPGMGLNAFFVFGFCHGLKLPWQVAMGAVFLSGCLAVVVTLTRARETIIQAIPAHLKLAVSAGIGFFIAFVGLQNAGIIVDQPGTLVGLGPLGEGRVLLAFFGLLLTAILLIRQVTGAILLGMLVTTLIAFFVPLPGGGYVAAFVPGSLGLLDAPPSLAPGFLQFDVRGALKVGLIVPIFSLFFVDLFDTIGTFVGVAEKTGMMDERGVLKGGGRALFADSMGTVIGALLGTSNTTAYIESAAGVQAGGRTGLTTVVVGLCFLLSTCLSPVVKAVPAAATAPALILVGVLMASALRRIRWDEVYEAIPAFLVVLLMPLTFSISTGLAVGFLAHVLLAVLTGRAREVHWFMYILAALFTLYFVVS
jgi:AGZA family xanthine/uracil permease-like MFS transporter